jgi:nitrous oxidase accessory protein NosD
MVGLRADLCVVGAVAAAVFATGCNMLSGVDDLAFDLEPPVSPPEPCVEPSLGMSLTTSTRFCAGTYTLAGTMGTAAVDIAADGVELDCDGTILDGGGVTGEPLARSVGIHVGAHAGVTVRGCTARGYGHGFAADGSADVVLDAIHADDNFHDPAADWILEDVPGGGVLFRDVTGGLLTGSTFARNWNGVEIRSSRDVTVSGNVADHCSSTGALLIDAHDSTIEGNDFSWAIRGQVDYPNEWYGVDTKDSAGIIIESGSTGNIVRGNLLVYGGNGLFVRSLYGACPTDNDLLENDTSYSPHNGIECWCDRHLIQGNTSLESNYGLWTGGADDTILRSNEVLDSRVDGISIQIGESRHVVIEDNRVNRSGRVGILVSGREYQEWQDLTYWAANVANSSQIVIQRNELFQNVSADLFVTSARLVVAASNCSPNHDGYEFGQEAEVTALMGNCGTATDRVPPSAQLAETPSVTVGAMLAVDAAGSRPAEPGDMLVFRWLIQPAGRVFPGGALPAVLLAGVGAAQSTVVADSPGMFDVDVTVDDGRLAANAHRQVAVLPVGTEVGSAAADWTFECPAETCTTTFADEAEGVDGTQVHMTTDAAFELRAIAPAGKNLALNASTKTAVGFFVRAHNVHEWQLASPAVVLGNANGVIRYEPVVNLLPRDASEWAFVSVPLAGGSGWTRTDAGGSLGSVQWVELRMDTWDAGYDVWLDRLVFY